MRLWSIDFSYLDRKGLLAVWREALLAKAVLSFKTKGYKNHPQLERFKSHSNPLKAINTYLFYIYEESKSRNYNFDLSKIDLSQVDSSIKIKVTKGQLRYEFEHLLRKLQKRDHQKYLELLNREHVNPIDLLPIP
ncbi:pyrimidine dimer DNA glycosylase/endonuclease V [Thermotoga profunda]|uniref:pyrimidine dimer DNA glycosylase/endonuclease V n=1 Tax=Thermotoga profunda TaxID=1508420 RepID=UPI000597A2AC|nr:pyrimidine dimer DNA glycosylase/endonuclease V [Thermotoga profunda]